MSSKVLINFRFYMSIKLTVISLDPVTKYAPSSEKDTLYTQPKNNIMDIYIYLYITFMY